MGPLGRGLSGKYKPGERVVTGARSERNWAFPQGYFAPNADETLRLLLDLSAASGLSAAQNGDRLNIEQPGITSAIIGPRTVEQARDNLKAGTARIEEKALKQLNVVSSLPDRYPESIEKNMHVRRDNAVKMPV